LSVDWYNAGGGVISTSTGPSVAMVAGWQRIIYTVTSPALTVTAVPYADFDGSNGVFSLWMDVPQFEAGAFASSAIPTGTVALTRAGESLTVPFNFGATANITILTRFARSVWVDVAGALGNRYLYDLGTAASNVSLLAQNAARNWSTQTGGSSTAVAIPAGAELKNAAQYKNLTTAPQTAIDTGSGLSAFSAAGTPFAAYSNQTLRLGTPAGEELYGVLLDLIIARGLRSFTEMLAIP